MYTNHTINNDCLQKCLNQYYGILHVYIYRQMNIPARKICQWRRLKFCSDDCDIRFVIITNYSRSSSPTLIELCETMSKIFICQSNRCVYRIIYTIILPHILFIFIVALTKLTKTIGRYIHMCTRCGHTVWATVWWYVAEPERIGVIGVVRVRPSGDCIRLSRAPERTRVPVSRLVRYVFPAISM